MTKQQQKEVDKIHAAYQKAELGLINRRDELFPIGTLVQSRIDRELTARIVDKSDYADKVYTDCGYMSWQYLEVVG